MSGSSETNWLTSHGNILLAMAVSAVFHVISAYSYFAWHSSNLERLNTSTQKPVNIRFTMLPTPPQETLEQVIKPVPIQPEPKPEPEPVTKTVPQPAVQPVIEKIALPQPELKKTRKKPEAKPKPVVKKANKVAQKQVVPVKTDEPESKTEEIIQQAAPLPFILVEDKPSAREVEETYITLLLNHIENHKYYPRKARRRNIEGTVKVILSINAEGSVASMELSEGHAILRKAAEKAIYQSLPFARPPLSMISPKTISFGISYRFRQP